MDIFKKTFIFFALCFICDCIVSFLPFPFPGSVLAMVVLFVLLATKVIRVEQLTPVADFFLTHMSVAFIPTTVAIISYVDILKNILWQFIFVCIITTIITFTATAYAVKFTTFLVSRKKGGKEQ